MAYVYANGTGHLVENIEDIYEVIARHMGDEFVTGIQNIFDEGFVDAREYAELYELNEMGDKKIEELTHERYELTMENIKLRDRIAELDAELNGIDKYPAEFFDNDGNLKPEFADESCIEMPVKKTRKPRTRKAA